MCAWINDWVNNHEAGDLRRHCAHYDVNIMSFSTEPTHIQFHQLSVHGLPMTYYLSFVKCLNKCNYHLFHSKSVDTTFSFKLCKMTLNHNFGVNGLVLSSRNCPNSQIPECARSKSHNPPFKTEMCTFLFCMEPCEIGNSCILGFVKLDYSFVRIHMKIEQGRKTLV